MNAIFSTIRKKRNLWVLLLFSLFVLNIGACVMQKIMSAQSITEGLSQKQPKRLVDSVSELCISEMQQMHQKIDFKLSDVPHFLDIGLFFFVLTGLSAGMLALPEFAFWSKPLGRTRLPLFLRNRILLI